MLYERIPQVADFIGLLLGLPLRTCSVYLPVALRKCDEVGALGYGPVLFVFDIDIINANGTGRILVTKLNPTKWARKRDSERWFQHKDDLEQNFVKGRFDQMLVLRHCGGALPFGKHLKKIILNDPQRQTKGDVDFYSMAVGALRLAMQDAKINVPISRRKCAERCICEQDWGGNDKRLFQMFDPKI